MIAKASQIAGRSIVYSIVCWGADQRKRQSSASLAFVRENHQWRVNSQRASNAENVSIWWRHHEMWGSLPWAFTDLYEVSLGHS